MTAARPPATWLAGATCLSLAAASALVPTPHDPFGSGRCGSLLGGGFTATLFSCEQTRGVYRAAALLGVALGLAFVVAHFTSRRWALVSIAAVSTLGAVVVIAL